MLHVLLVAVCLKLWGLEGSGVAFALTYVLVTLGYYAVCHRVSGFGWSRRSLSVLASGAVLCGVAFVMTQSLPPGINVPVATIFAVTGSAFCLRALARTLGVGVRELLRARLGPLWGQVGHGDA
jgi:hypothetical protein